MVHPLEEALALFKQEKYEKAIIRSQKVALHEPNNTNALMIIGKSNFALEKVQIHSLRQPQISFFTIKWEECEKAFLRVTELKPGFPAVWRVCPSSPLSLSPLKVSVGSFRPVQQPREMEQKSRLTRSTLCHFKEVRNSSKTLSFG